MSNRWKSLGDPGIVVAQRRAVHLSWYSHLFAVTATYEEGSR